ncbi:HD domain containing protein [Tritrichomonas foetus]|uniref:HD domain containing protein n=1 Tax=Tritrichomonas foetus TaxID=1144522 RepID=A0A1J4K838_9EUKA|nr:HD domain containing protein [Tritrichomonas foetus]|eukprot:OHT07371.1 HD domain containing protein [Tritrichomonas foetus]
MEGKELRGHSPQDELYGPIKIPPYCWPIIDTYEYQRIRHIFQLGTCHYVFPGATHTRFEHCLGVAHLASVFMEHIKNTQPELGVTEEHCQSVIIAGLCHDLGHGPWSHKFEYIAKEYDPSWDHEDMSCQILKHIYDKYKLPIKKEVIEAACNFILGLEYPGYPIWLSRIIANKENDIDLDKFDYLARDINRTLSIARFQYDRLIFHCRVVDNQLAWRQSEMNTIERLFYNRNDMHKRVYQHRVNQGISCMIADMLEAADSYINIETVISDIEEYVKLDDRIMTHILEGDYGEEAQRIALDIEERRLYKCIGELRMKPENLAGLTYSQLPVSTIENDIAEFSDNLPPSKLRVVKITYRFGLKENKHPLLSIPFWKPGNEHAYFLTEDDISCIVPVHFMETAMRVYVTDPASIDEARKAFNKWKESKKLQ